MTNGLQTRISGSVCSRSSIVNLLVLADVVICLYGIQLLETFETGVGHILLVFAPRDSFFLM